MSDSSSVFPNTDRWDFEFEHAKAFNRYLGDAIIARDGGVSQAKRVGGLRREAQSNRRIEIWEINRPAYLLRLRHLGNSFYFEILDSQLGEEISHLVEEEDWWVDHVDGPKMTKLCPDEHIPDEGYVNTPNSW